MYKKFDFKDITLVPETLSSISSRSEIDILTDYCFSLIIQVYEKEI